VNNLQYIVKDNTRFAMHMAVELCEQGDFDSLREALIWLEQEHETTKLSADDVRHSIESRFGIDVWVPNERWQAIADELNAVLSGKREQREDVV
jgi:hypothetical protein